MGAVAVAGLWIVLAAGALSGGETRQHTLTVIKRVPYVVNVPVFVEKKVPYLVKRLEPQTYKLVQKVPVQVRVKHATVKVPVVRPYTVHVTKRVPYTVRQKPRPALKKPLAPRKTHITRAPPTYYRGDTQEYKDPFGQEEHVFQFVNDGEQSQNSFGEEFNRIENDLEPLAEDELGDEGLEFDEEYNEDYAGGDSSGQDDNGLLDYYKQ